MDIYRDNKFIFLVAMFLLSIAGVIYYPATVSGIIIIGALIIFGSASLMWKEPTIKIAALIFLVLIALSNIYFNGVTFGIDFSGGTRIPVTLDHSVDQTTMNEMVQTIKKRVSVFGLTQVKVRAIGDSQINVELPSDDEEMIASVESTLSKQGVYQGVVDGKVAVSGDHIFSQSIRPTDAASLQHSGAAWGISFSVDNEGAKQFADAAKGKADYPVYMFLDRPGGATIFFEREAFKSFVGLDSGEKETMSAMRDALVLEGEEDIPVYIIEDLDQNFTADEEYNVALVLQNMSAGSKALLVSKGFELKEIEPELFVPEFSRTKAGVLFLSKLDGVGLLSSPILNAGVATGIQTYSYTITGGVTATDSREAAKEASDKMKEMESILKGGSLPVKISLGSRTTVPPSLGSEFLRLSLVAIALSLVAISVLIGVRYRNLRATMPIVLISLAELAILISILGSFTIDLAAMAGIIAAIGVGVDAQIVITDELLKKDERKTAEKIDLAFGIIKTNATVAIFSMVPLLFSGLVEIIGFAESSILGALLGYMLTRPAYAAVVEKVIAAEKTLDHPPASP